MPTYSGSSKHTFIKSIGNRVILTLLECYAAQTLVSYRRFGSTFQSHFLDDETDMLSLNVGT
jgi:hypothetical protein